MSVNAVAPAANQAQMSKKEHIVRTMYPGGSYLYDIGKALTNGKNISEAYDTSNKNIQTVSKRNWDAVKDAHNKAMQDCGKDPLSFITDGYLLHFVKNLFE